MISVNAEDISNDCFFNVQHILPRDDESESLTCYQRLTTSFVCL